MDTITHLALGAIIGETVASKQLGKKAMLYGALSQALPDIDSLAVFWLSPVDNLLAHRGITHSLLCALIMSLLLAYAFHRWQGSMSRLKWILFFGVQLFTHLSIDSLNAYGTGWLEPFSDYR
ncbi:MAG TPA: metal-dependent hydrolase, partial [Cyclobacteriaceae bacterium]|nr:metal-dependent hydrolase [Cyclobacteriaceae bacterium]